MSQMLLPNKNLAYTTKKNKSEKSGLMPQIIQSLSKVWSTPLTGIVIQTVGTYCVWLASQHFQL